jgi:hypothetical protein
MLRLCYANRALPLPGAVILKIILRRILKINWRGLSTYPSENHVVRLAVGNPWYPDTPDVTVQRSFDGQGPVACTGPGKTAAATAQDNVQNTPQTNSQNDTLRPLPPCHSYA